MLSLINASSYIEMFPSFVKSKVHYKVFLMHVSAVTGPSTVTFAYVLDTIKYCSTLG